MFSMSFFNVRSLKTFLKEENPGNKGNLSIGTRSSFVYLLLNMSKSLHAVSTILSLLSLLPPPSQYVLVTFYPLFQEGGGVTY